MNKKHQLAGSSDLAFTPFPTGPSQISRTGLATKMDEYVPTIIPTIMAKAKSWITPPPRIKRQTTTTSVVVDVRIVRLNVPLILRFITSSKGRLLKRFRFSLILSKTMMVSFKE